MGLIKEHKILRGEIYWVKLDPTLGSETKKTRPCIIVSNNMQNNRSKRLIVVPLTSVTKAIFPIEVLIKVNGVKSKAMTDQIRTVDIQRLGKKICKVSLEEMRDIEKALKIVLQLS